MSIFTKKYHDKRKERMSSTAGKTSYHSNIADNYLAVQNMVQNHAMVQQVVHLKGKMPTVTFTDEQIMDIKKLCCSGCAVLGFDKTFNIVDGVFVTASTFKQLAVTNVDGGDTPIFLGPVFLHGNSTFETYVTFSMHSLSN